MELKLFELNGIDLTPFTRRTTDLQVADAEAVGELGIEVKSLAETGSGVRTITWVGNVTDEATYLDLRKEMFGTGPKILKLTPDRLIRLTGLKAEKNVDLTDQSKTNLTLTLFAADPFEYKVIESTEQVTVTGQGAAITLTNNGEAPTIPEWEITASGQIIDPSLSDPSGSVIEWNGVIEPGQVLRIRSDGTVTLDGADAGNIIGLPLRVQPGSTVIVFNDDPGSSHSCVLKAVWRDAYY